MAIAKRTQVALGTVAVFVMAIFGLGVFSFTSITGRSGVTTTAESDSRVVELSFSPETVSGTVPEKAVVVDLIAKSKAGVLGATLVFRFDPTLINMREVNAAGGVLGDAYVAFDFDNGLLTLTFKPGKAVSLPQGSRLADSSPGIAPFSRPGSKMPAPNWSITRPPPGNSPAGPGFRRLTFTRTGWMCWGRV